MADKQDNKTHRKEDLGNQIFNMVMDSIDSMDFTGLSSRIKDAAASAMDDMARQFDQMQSRYQGPGTGHGRSGPGHGYFGNGAGWKDLSSLFGRGGFSAARKKKDVVVDVPYYEEEADGSFIKRETGAGSTHSRQRAGFSGTSSVHTGYRQTGRKVPGTFSGPIQIAAGGTGLALFGGTSLGLGLSSTALGLFSGTFTAAALTGLGFSLPLAILSGVILGRGVLFKNRARRLNIYTNQWKDKTFIMLSDLARETGLSVKQIKKDIYYLIDRRVFPGIRMDQEETCLLLTDEAIAQYEAAKESQRMREEEARRQQQEMEEFENAPDEEKEMTLFIRRSEETLKELDRHQSAIRDPAMKDRLDRLELTITRIFVCVKEHPDKLRLTRRLMNYYLPSVMKLLTVYEDMEKQPIRGENISSTMGEIASSLDTINDALTKMYDELFQEEALDVSADIQVLKAMLARDGYGEEQLKK